MNLTILREPEGKDWTFGKLYIEDEYFSETLEDRIREVEGKPVSSWKIKSKTAIPFGYYKVELHDSPKFGRIVPILRDVEGFTYVLIHWGNYIEDTDGCILVGTGRRGNAITDSRKAFNRLFPLIEAAIKNGEEVWLGINSIAT